MTAVQRPVWAPPDLTRDEINEICFPLKQKAAQVRFLRSLGLRVEQRPDGSPLINRAYYNSVRGGVVQRPPVQRSDWQPPPSPPPRPRRK